VSDDKSSEIAKKNPMVEFLATIRSGAVAYIGGLHFGIPESQIQRRIDQFVTGFRSEANKNPKLFECTPQSLIRAMSLSLISDLAPGGLQPVMWLIPRKNKAGMQECNAEISWRGYVALAGRSGVRVDAIPVFRADKFSIIEGLTPTISHEPDPDADHTWETLRGVYVRIYAGDSLSFSWISRGDIQKRRQSAQSDDIWAKWPIEQAQKTAIRYAAQRGRFPLDPEGSAALAEDRGEPEAVEVLAERPETKQITSGLAALESEVS
jgi:recombination protein RecT